MTDEANTLTVTVHYTVVDLGEIFVGPWNHDDEEEDDDE